MKPKKQKRTEKYWICDQCAKKQKLIPPKWPVTATEGLCGWCKRKDKTILVPVCDYEDPKTGRKPVWD